MSDAQMSGRARPRPSRTPYWIALGVVVAVVTMAWFNRDRIRPVAAGFPAPSFQVVNLDNEPVELEDYEGQVILLNIWATWCAPCRAEMPSMERLYEEFGDQDFEILAINIDARPGEFDGAGRPGRDPVAFADSLALTFPILLNPPGDIQRTYQTTGVPESFLIGRDGVIYKSYAGSTHWDSEANRNLVRRLLEGEAAS
ncbi:MAG: TlpA family protein disulfide reductase [Longimicrobiales bacterium]